MGRASLSYVAAFALALASESSAADLFAPPSNSALSAVDGINGKVAAYGGWSRGGSDGRDAQSGGVSGSLALPLGAAFGLQIDGLLARQDGRFAGGAGAHLFRRDPTFGLLGLYASALGWDKFGGLAGYKLGLEGELYLGRLTLSGMAGLDRGTRRSVALGSMQGFDLFALYGGDRFFDRLDASFYLTDNLKLSVGHRYESGRHAAAFGGEALIPVAGGAAMTAFAEARVGERGNRSVWAGVRVYFGQSDKPLIRRHREDDPPNYLSGELAAMSQPRKVIAVATTPATQPANISPAPPSNPATTATTATPAPQGCFLIYSTFGAAFIGDCTPPPGGSIAIITVYFPGYSPPSTAGGSFNYAGTLTLGSSNTYTGSTLVASGAINNLASGPAP